MAALVVQSRFAGLKIEDEEHTSSHDGQKAKKNKVPTSKKTDPPKKVKSTISSKPQTAAPKKKKPKQNTPSLSAEQWELWKQKDEEMVDGNYESELQQAIMLSKLDFEEKKDVYKQFKKDAEMQKKLAEQNARLEKLTKKQKKKTVMSLDQFNGLPNSGEETRYNHEDEKDPTVTIKSPDKDTEFFERIIDDTKNELLKDKINDRIKDRQNVAEEVITRIQFADALERKNQEIAELKQEIISLKQELLTVKSRNKKLCNILGQGEMRDKAEVLVEVERLRAVQTELTAEIATLHIDLEKERSKNADPRAKDKKNSTKKKTIRFDVSAETETKESSSGTTH